MRDHFADRLIDAIAEKGNPLCVGIDPVYEMLPDEVAGDPAQRDANDREAALDAIFEFVTGILQVVAPLAPCVKFQSAYFERYLWDGVEAYYSLIQEAKDLGLVVIGDVKRGDIGATSEAYAAAHLAELPRDPSEDAAGVVEGLASTPDAITVNPFLGFDTLAPFVKTAREEGKGLFVLVRTSNPGSKDLQDVATVDGRTFSELIADGLHALASGEGMVGAEGYSAVGAVVGATQTHMMRSLRARLPRSIFLLPGYGAQGATAEMTRAAFDDHGRGAIVSASRSILYAHRDPRFAGADWKRSVESAVRAMRDELATVLPRATKS